jgi:hypothetical protein
MSLEERDAEILTSSALTVSPTAQDEPAKPAEPARLDLTNAEFLAAVFAHLPEGAFAAACSKPGDPGKGGWAANRAELVAGQLTAANNNYVGCSSFFPGDDGSFKARKDRFAACHFLMLDDVGTKVQLERFAGFELSWLIETSPGNHQGGIILAAPLAGKEGGAAAVRLLNAVIEAGLCDAGATGPLSRWARLPVAINGKPKYASEDGAPFQCRLREWRPDKRYTPEEVVDRLQLELAPAGRPKAPWSPQGTAPARRRPVARIGNANDDVLTPKAAQNPVVAALMAQGLYKTPLGSGKHDITCPWIDAHTDAVDTGAAYFEPDEGFPIGGFRCQHSHGDQYHVRQLLEFLEVPAGEARHKPTIKVVAGELHRVVDAGEKELAARGRHYQAGGLIVSVSTDLTTGDPSVVPTSLPALTRELSIAATWEKYDGRAEAWVRSDPPTRHTGVLFDAQQFRYLPPLAGVARQPYFREAGGELVTQPGFDRASQRFAVFDARHFVFPKPTHEAAREALALLEDLLTEFHFVAATDKAAALAAILTAVARPTLAHAPAFHVRAPVFGSGKTYLCELIGAFAGPGGNSKVSYPTTSEEATKVMLSLLLTSPAVIEFDDMDTDWIPHGTIKRMLTAEHITDRILGVSKTATVSTRALFLGSGNNVGPIRDLLRRVLTINIDPRCATPATLAYKGFPVERVRQHRGKYVAAALTIIRAWRAAGWERGDVTNIVTFGGEWADCCRHPLMWLGHPDPATSLLEQVRSDPDSEALGDLMAEWHDRFGGAPTKLREALELAGSCPELREAICEFPVTDRAGKIIPEKLGWILKKNANRICGGFSFQKAGGRGGVWRVIPVNRAGLTGFTGSAPALEKTVTTTMTPWREKL